MRFAIGSIPQLEQFMGSIDMGNISKKAMEMDSQQRAYGTKLHGRVGADGISAAANAKSGGIMGSAAAAAGRYDMFGSFANTIGDFALGYGDFKSSRPPTNNPPPLDEDADDVPRAGNPSVSGTDNGFYYGQDGRIYVNPT
jgi:hypothetical protein